MIKKATFDDLDMLMDLFEQYRIFYGKEPDPEGARRFMGERLREGDSEVFVCWAGDDCAGFVQLYPIFSSTRMKRLWLLNDLFVVSEHRGKGYSLALIERAKELSRDTGACGLLLETGVDNVVGNKLYPRAGFVQNKGSNFYEWGE